MIEASLRTSLEHAWNCYTSPEHMVHWNFASDDWQCPSASNDLRIGGRFTSRMEAKDGSFGFDFGGTYTQVVSKELLEYRLDDDRMVSVRFSQIEGGTKVEVVFDAENENAEELQRNGWQAILNNYKIHAEKTD